MTDTKRCLEICDELEALEVPAEIVAPIRAELLQAKPHDAGIDCLDGGWRGFQAVCWDCGWRGEKQLRDPDEPMGTEASRSHKRKARQEAVQHREETVSQPQEQEGPCKRYEIVEPPESFKRMVEPQEGEG